MSEYVIKDKMVIFSDKISESDVQIYVSENRYFYEYISYPQLHNFYTPVYDFNVNIQGPLGGSFSFSSYAHDGIDPINGGYMNLRNEWPIEKFVFSNGQEWGGPFSGNVTVLDSSVPVSISASNYGNSLVADNMYYKNINAYGGSGNDIIRISAETSFASGGDGDDDITIKSGNSGWASGGNGNDKISFEFENLYIDGESGNDTLIGFVGPNVFVSGGDGSDVIDVQIHGSNVTIAGGLGADSLRLAVGNTAHTWIFADAPTTPIQPQDALALLNTTPFIEIEASANLYEGAPLLNILVDGKTVASQVAITADFTKGERQTLRFTDPAFLGAGEISLRFLNDLWGGSRDTDRNVHIHQVKLPGRTLVNADAVYTVGGRTLSALQADGRNMLWTNGTLTFNAQPKEAGPVANELRIVASADAFEGNPVLRVAVDGVIVGDYEVSALRKDGQSQEFRLTVGNLLNSGNLELRMINDKWGGSKDKDRNLLISEVTLNGTRLDNRTATYDNRTGVTLNRKGEHFLFGGGTLRYGLAPYASAMNSPEAFPAGDTVELYGQGAATNFQIALDPLTGQPTGQFETFDSGAIITGGETADVFRLDHDTGGLVRGFEAGKDRIEIDAAQKSSLHLIEMMNATLLSFGTSDNGSSASISGYAIEGINAEQLAASLSFVTVG